LIASASVDGTVRIWDANDYSEKFILENSGAFCLAWSPDSKQVVVGSTSGRITILDLETQEILRTLSSGGFTVSIAWSPDGSLIAAGRLDGIISVWEAESGNQITLISGYSNSRSDANGLAFSPDGTVLASANQDGYTYLWNVENWELQNKKRQNSGWVRGVAWSPDGQLLASTGEDAKVRIWDVATDQNRGMISVPPLPVWSASWSPNGNQLAIGNGAYDNPETSGTLYLISVP
jgi:WD40 repeat protein